MGNVKLPSFGHLLICDKKLYNIPTIKCYECSIFATFSYCDFTFEKKTHHSQYPPPKCITKVWGLVCGGSFFSKSNHKRKCSEKCYTCNTLNTFS